MLTFPLTTIICLGLIAALCIAGRRLDRLNREHQLRFALAGLSLVGWVAMQTVYFLPGNFDPAVSWPLHICDIAAVVGPLAMLTRSRLLLSVLYFWGIGLTSQAFITPVLPPEEGPGSIWYWTFWSNHTIVVGLAVYAMVVLRYRPAFTDVLAVIGFTALWVALVLPLNLAYGWNYGYMSPELPGATTLLNALGDWPGRLFKMYAIVAAGFVVLWLPWDIATQVRKVQP
jgi:hypothetical integral membrane protein (TIGR02206 family)